jgi:hypothetical protein
MEQAMDSASLAGRLLDFSARAGKVVDALPRKRLAAHIASHLVRGGTAPGSHYEGGCGAESRADFVHKLQRVGKRGCGHLSRVLSHMVEATRIRVENGGMILHDHFRPPLSSRRHWHSFHNAWCTYLASHLNEQLPDGYFAEPNVQFGIEIDVAAWQEPPEALPFSSHIWPSPAPTQTVPLTLLTDIAEVLVYDRESGPVLTGAIELVSPANKDRANHRDAFLSKCAAYVQQGVGLIVVDIVTSRHARLHDELLARLQIAAQVALDADLCAVSYRATQHTDQVNLEIWQEPLSIGRTLPTLPLWLRGGICLRVDLATTYERTCREQRILAEGA